MKLRVALFLLALLPAGGSAAGLAQGSLEAKPFGVILLGDGGDQDWAVAESSMSATFSRRFPFLFVAEIAGMVDKDSLQNAVNAMQAKRVKKIVFVPLFLSSFSDLMDQNRFLLGIREKPPAAAAEGPSHTKLGLKPMAPKPFGAQRAARVKTKLPLVLTQALDDHPALVETLAARAASKSKDPASEALVLVNQGPAAPADADWSARLGALAEKVRVKGGFKSAASASTGANLPPDERRAAQKKLHQLVADLHRAGPVIVLPVEMSRSDIRLENLSSALGGVFVKVVDKAVLPDARIYRWVEESASAAEKLPDMRVFKDEAKGGPGASSLPESSTSGGYQ